MGTGCGSAARVITARLPIASEDEEVERIDDGVADAGGLGLLVSSTLGFVGFDTIEAILLRVGQLKRRGDRRAAELALLAATVVKRTGAGGALEAHGGLR